ncbi:hypothetical protein MASR1M90_05220 [Desulfovibrionales bacterium]
MKSLGLNSRGFITISIQFVLITSVAALFFAFARYLQTLGLDAGSIGTILSADALAALVLQPVLATVIHVRTARYWLVAGSVLLATSLVFLAQATEPELLIILRLMQGSGFICVLTSLMVLLVPLIPAGMSGRAFGWISLVRLIPYAVVPFVLDLCAATPSAFPYILHTAAVIALVPVAMMFLLPVQTDPGNADISSAPGFAGLRTSLGSLPVNMLLLSSLLFYCGYSALFFFLKQFVEGMGLGGVSLFFTTMTLVMFVVRVLGSSVFDQFNKMHFYTGGLALVAFSYALLPVCTSGAGLVGLAVVFGLGGGVAMPLQAALMFDLSVPQVRALNQNLLLVMMQGGFFLGPLLGGHVLEQWNFTVFFIVLAVCTMIAAGLVFTPNIFKVFS